jgi:hypothetical protein
MRTAFWLQALALALFLTAVPMYNFRELEAARNLTR